MASLRAGQPEMEHRAAARDILRPDASAMRLDDGLADGETYAHAFFLGGEKWLKESLCRLRCDPRPGIRHRNAHKARFSRRGDGDVPASLHRIDGVADQIEQHLLDLDFVDQNRR